NVGDFHLVAPSHRRFRWLENQNVGICRRQQRNLILGRTTPGPEWKEFIDSGRNARPRPASRLRRAAVKESGLRARGESPCCIPTVRNIWNSRIAIAIPIYSRIDGAV